MELYFIELRGNARGRVWPHPVGILYSTLDIAEISLSWVTFSKLSSHAHNKFTQLTNILKMSLGTPSQGKILATPLEISNSI